MISSSRFRNSGRNAWRTTSITWLARLARRRRRRAGPPRYSRAEVRGQHDQRVAEVDRAALAVGQPAVVEHLEQHVEHVRVRLLDLVEQDHLVGPPAHRLGQAAALLVADVAGRRADQPGDRVLLHVLGHVDADHRLLVVEQELGERLASARSCRRRWARGTGTSRSAGSGPAARRGRAGPRSRPRPPPRPGRPRAGAGSPPSRSSFSRSPSSIRSTGMPVQRDDDLRRCRSAVTASSTMLPAFLRLGLGRAASRARGCAP